MGDDYHTEFPSSQPSSTPTLNHLANSSSFPTSNDTSYPSSVPTSNYSAFPSSRPSSVQNKTVTFLPSSAPHAPYDIVNDITNPKKFNFVALSLSLGLLLVVVAVTVYGFLQRYTIVKRKTRAARKYRNLKASKDERMEMYFAEDVGATDDTNEFARSVYSGKSPIHKSSHLRLNTPLGISTSSTYVQSPTGEK